MLTTRPLVERGWPAASEAMEWLEMLDLELAAETRRIEAEARFALWTRLVALEAARELQQDEAARQSSV